ncbi:MAG TPA: DNA mismatch repair protein MutS [Candidatus Poseidoniales archaeon]|jgi:DNA mismatch repair protein MutS|nr:MAG: DNA mismatch repair protein MutS [Euryarchaeota archaeon]HIF45943.1 DNA mismatch repair protein MutS [Candidatus Poseidoniales archaeon]HIL64617.1 DNA mismatch repair protein MutS [Candidatus Poseidoniales archaeon]
MTKRGMMDQYMDIKTAHPDSVLFFRMGDFYEQFHDDAIASSATLGITLTSRDKKASEPIPMAGFPWHALEDNLRKMLAAGHKVCVAEQEDELREGSKILERVVSRVYTPGSLYEESLIGTDDVAMLAAIVVKADKIGLAILDASTGNAWTVEHGGEERWARSLDDLLRAKPSEVVFSSRDANRPELLHLVSLLDRTVLSQHNTSEKRGQEALKNVLAVSDLGHIDLGDSPLAMIASGLAADYLASVQIVDEVNLRNIEIMRNDDSMILDQTTLKNLELITTLAGEKEGSLLGAIDKCRTSMGRRTLRNWLLRPLSNIEQISMRHDAVASCARSSKRLDQIRQSLLGLRDLERLATQLSYNRSGGRDLVAIAIGLERMPKLKSLLLEMENDLFNDLAEILDSLEAMKVDIQANLNENQPLSLRDGGLIREGIDSKLDDYRNAAQIGHQWFKDFEQKHRAMLEIPSLKVRHNRQIGWFIEVTKTHVSKVPEQWRRKQQMTNGNRYITDELVEWEDKLLSADSKANKMEYDLFRDLRDRCKIHVKKLSEISNNIAQIDVLQCFSSIARTRTWNRPTMFEDDRLVAKGLRHPVLELQSGFVPNDLKLDKNRKFLLITGPNMGGKSTHLRCAALLAILAQAGSFVPAQSAQIGIVDRIFTRVGASDDIRRGRSTFMMEMMEVAHILKRASENSLILLDEIGRGTSTFDGLSIAWSVTEDICNRIRARTLFATHYHQLIGLEGDAQGLVNVHVQVAESDGELKFLHTVADGPCDDSYGVQVAALAGLPRHVVERSGDLLGFLEKQAQGAKAGESGTPHARSAGQASLMGFVGQPKTIIKNDPIADKIKQSLAGLDLDSMSPREAQQALYDLQRIEDGE